MLLSVFRHACQYRCLLAGAGAHAPWPVLWVIVHSLLHIVEWSNHNVAKQWHHLMLLSTRPKHHIHILSHHTLSTGKTGLLITEVRPHAASSWAALAEDESADRLQTGSSRLLLPQRPGSIVPHQRPPVCVVDLAFVVGILECWSNSWLVIVSLIGI